VKRLWLGSAGARRDCAPASPRPRGRAAPHFTVRGHALTLRLVVRPRNLPLVAMIGPLFGCCTILGEIPGVFYQVQFSDPPGSTVCREFAHELTADLQLRLVSNEVVSRPKGGCIAVMNYGNRDMAVTLVSDPPDRRLGVAVQSFAFNSAVAPTPKVRDVASKILAITQSHFSDAKVTPVHPCRGPFGP